MQVILNEESLRHQGRLSLEENHSKETIYCVITDRRG